MRLSKLLSRWSFRTLITFSICGMFWKIYQDGLITLASGMTLSWRKFNKCIYRSWNEVQFEKRWWKLIERFNLREDEWLQALYEDRKLWVPAFMKDVSFAGLSAASRSESLNSFFDRYIHGKCP
ncbi:UNVERIFIED_CONTAM: protein FAR1-RELATED SEQUENCE 4 [Sesamum radiatum]|uniref:Protein FAR1-RELATED SEQUENCE n=1 Tax=Sesamum radiatum TaxID=300843 RepID=A0AAW2PHW3_SESRA